MMLFFIMILELFGFYINTIHNIIKNKIERREYIHKEMTDYFIKIELSIDNYDLKFSQINNIQKTKNESIRKTIDFIKFKSISDLSDILNSIKEQIFDEEYFQKYSCYLLVKIVDVNYVLNLIDRFKEYDFFINGLQEKVNELPNCKLVVNTYHNPRGFFDFKFPEESLNKYKYDMLFKKEQNYIFQDNLEKQYIYMVISSEEFSDEFFIDYFVKNEHNNENLKMITDCNTKNFVIRKIIGPLMRHFNFSTLNFMTTKMELDLRHEAKDMEVEDIINLKKSILDDNFKLAFIYTNERLNDWLATCQTNGFIMRFIQVLLLVKSNLLEKVIREIMFNSDDEVLDFLMSYLVDTKIITNGEKIFLQKAENKFSIRIFLENYFFEVIAKRICFSNIIPFSDDVSNNRKFFILLFIGFIREYRNINIIQLIQYLNFICYEEMKELHRFVISMESDIQESEMLCFGLLVYTHYNPVFYF